MSGRAGIELTPMLVRLVRLAPLTGRVSQTLELAWDYTKPRDIVAQLRAKVGDVQSITVTIGLGFLEVARLELPPVPASDRARIVELEPDRYFASAVNERLVVTVAPDEPIAFGAPASLVESWLAAFESWAPVNWVEAAPLSLARAIGAHDGTYAVEAGGDEAGVLQIARGRVASVRRSPDRRIAADARPIPTGAVPAPFTAALGAARWQMQRVVPSPLAPDEWRRRASARRRITTLLNVFGAAAALIFAAWAADRWRERTVTALEARIADVETRAAPADTALRMLRSREAEARTIADIAINRPDPHAALAAISAALPREATVLTARASGNDWQIDGTTSDASALVPLLDRHQQFDSVRFLSASSRYREANRAYETFSIAFRFRP